MSPLTKVATFALVTVVLAYSYLKLRDARLRRRGATSSRLSARSEMTVLNFNGARAGIIGLSLLLFGIWIPVEHELNKDPIPWWRSGLLVLIGTVLLVSSVRSLRKAVQLKQYSEDGSPE